MRLSLVEINGQRPRLWGLNSAGEYYLHTVGVTGSNPVAPTILFSACDPAIPRALAPGRRAMLLAQRLLDLPIAMSAYAIFTSASGLLEQPPSGGRRTATLLIRSHVVWYL